MKNYKSFAIKELLAQKMTSVLILIAIVLSTLMTTAIGQSLGILQALQQQQAGMLNGYRYATFHNISAEQKNTLERDERISQAGSTITISTARLANSGLSLQLKEYDQSSLDIYPANTRLREGRLPVSANEIALPEDALRALGFSGSLGDTISLDLSISLISDDQPAHIFSADFTLTGILESNTMGYSSGVVSGIAGAGTADALLPERYILFSTDIVTFDKSSFQQTMNDLISVLSFTEKQVQYNWVYLNALGVQYDVTDATKSSSGMSFMTVAGVMIGALILMAAGLVIYNILKIAVQKRLKEYGTLRAIGAEKGQLFRLVGIQLALLCGTGIPIGAGLGLLSAGAITRMATSLFEPDAFMAQSVVQLQELIEQNSGGKLLPLLVSAGVTLLFALLAAFPAARYAARVSPTVAMTGTSEKIKRRRRKTGHIRSFEAFYARLNLRRNPGRTAITILSLVMSITVFVGVSAFSSLLDASADVKKLHLGDYSIANTQTGFPPKEVQTLHDNPSVESMQTLKYMLYMPEDETPQTSIELMPGETLHIIGIDMQRFETLFPDATEQQTQAFMEGKSCLIKNPIQIAYGEENLLSSSFDSGDSIEVAGHQIDVLSSVEAAEHPPEVGFVNGIQVIVYDTFFDILTGETNYTALFPKLREGADEAAFVVELDALTARAGGYWLSYSDADQQLDESFSQIRTLAYGLIALIALIALLNIINTTYTSILTRTREIGTHRAIGMSKASLYKTFLWESAWYAIIASIAGAVLGTVCTWLVSAAATEQFAITAPPITHILAAAICSVFACLLATVVPLRQIAKLNVVDAIEAIE